MLQRERDVQSEFQFDDTSRISERSILRMTAKNAEEKFVETLAELGVKGVDGVVGGSLTHLTDPLKRFVWIFALAFSVVLPAHAQQTDELQKQLEQLKQQYEKTTRELQERIAVLEQQIKKENADKQNAPKREGTVSARRQGLRDQRGGYCLLPLQRLIGC